MQDTEAHFVTIKTQAMLEAETQVLQAQKQTIKAYLSTKLSKIEAISDSSSTKRLKNAVYENMLESIFQAKVVIC